MTGSAYKTLDNESIVSCLAKTDNVTDVLGNRSDQWTVAEIGDGNVNLVFRIHSEQGSIIVKQALPYVRARGEDWPLALTRAKFEREALIRAEERAPGMTPVLIHGDDDLALTVMEDLTPHIILRKGLVRGRLYPKVAQDLGRYLARTLFRGSDYFLDPARKRADLAFFAGNHELCAVTEARVFTEPYFDAPLNRWNTPHLDEAVARIRADDEYKAAIQHMMTLFMTNAESLLHGDLHSGSVMVTADDTRVIDPEFAFYGPMSFDVGALLGNYLIAYMAQPGQADSEDKRRDYSEWILSTIADTWSFFAAEFRHLWTTERNGALFQKRIFTETESSTEFALGRLLRRIFDESLGFAAAKMTRRIIGAAHVEDLESIENRGLRAQCEKHVLMLARELLLSRTDFSTINDVLGAARDIRDREPAI